MKVKNIVSPRDAEGRLFLNNGPINPVSDHDSAWSMALSSLRAIKTHERLVKWIAGADEQFPGAVVIPEQYRQRAAVPLQETMHSAEEKSRSSIAGQSLEKARLLYDLVELTPIDAKVPPVVQQ